MIYSQPVAFLFVSLIHINQTFAHIFYYNFKDFTAKILNIRLSPCFVTINIPQSSSLLLITALVLLVTSSAWREEGEEQELN